MKVARKNATEELTADATVTDFIAEISKNAADFIKNNRGAFNADDTEAVGEFINVFSVADVREGILAALQVTDEEDTSLADDVADTQETEAEEPKEAEQENDELVSADVMALLDE